MIHGNNCFIKIKSNSSTFGAKSQSKWEAIDPLYNKLVFLLLHFQVQREVIL